MSLLPFLFLFPLWALIPYLLAVYYLRSFTPFAQHNHAHLAVFNRPLLNGIYNVLLAQCTGYQTALWELHHNRGHHRNFLDAKNDVASIVNPKTGTIFSRWMYALRGNLTIHRDSVKIGLQERGAGKRSLLPKLGVEIAIQLAIYAALLYWDWKMALACFIVPGAFAAWFIWWESYPHHLEVPTENIYDGSVTILSKAYNNQTFNIGHHTAHHEKPTLHWSLLPKRTAEILEKMPAGCVHEQYHRFASKQAAETRRLRGGSPATAVATPTAAQTAAAVASAVSQEISRFTGDGATELS
ncbi:MAG: fatty acid desaturase [Deltaproteobacteria bacterium]|nr:fatty acid desaturase [Deltaproteobacteria bacterium]